MHASEGPIVVIARDATTPHASGNIFNQSTVKLEQSIVRPIPLRVANAFLDGQIKEGDNMQDYIVEATRKAT